MMIVNEKLDKTLIFKFLWFLKMILNLQMILTNLFARYTRTAMLIAWASPTKCVQ